MSALTGQKLWHHEDPSSTRTDAFKKSVQDKYNVQLEDYESLRQWSVGHLAQFWEEVWYFTGIRASTSFTKVGITRHSSTCVFAARRSIICHLFTSPSPLLYLPDQRCNSSMNFPCIAIISCSLSILIFSFATIVSTIQLNE